MKFKFLFEEEQEYTSEDTANNQIAATFTNFDFTGLTVLDYGCGKGLAKEYCEKTFDDCAVYNFDPYHHFDEIRDFERDPNPNKVVTCNNVLNVIKDDYKTLVLDKIYKIAKRNSIRKIIFKIYERNGDGIGVQTGPKDWQRNEKTVCYIPAIEDTFKGYSVKKKGLFIIVTK